MCITLNFLGVQIFSFFTVLFSFSYIQTLGTAACPPYHLAFVVGGTSAEFNLKTVKLASTKYLDTLATTGITKSRINQIGGSLVLLLCVGGTSTNFNLKTVVKLAST